MRTIIKLRGVKNLESDIRLSQLYNQFDILLSELRKNNYLIPLSRQSIMRLKKLTPQIL